MSGKILVVDDAKMNRVILRALLERNFYTVIEAENGEEAVALAKSLQPDLVLLDIYMPNMDGIAVCRLLKRDQETATIPIVMVTSAESLEEKHQGLEAGADDFLAKPIDEHILFARIRNLLRMKSLLDELKLRSEAVELVNPVLAHMELPEDFRANIVIVCDDGESSSVILEKFQQDFRLHVELVTSEGDAILMSERGDIDAYIVFEELADEGIGHRLIANLRGNWANRSSVMIFIAKDEAEQGLRALDLGANDYTIAPLDVIELKMRLFTQLKRRYYADGLRDNLNRQLRLSVIDPLTDLHNRRYLDFYLPKILDRAKEQGRDFAVMTIDLDHFKTLNDEYGHDFGDEVLVEFSRRLKENMRAADLIVRLGGEEFLIVAPNLNKDTASAVAQRLLNVISGTGFERASGEVVTVTASIGVCIVPPDERDQAKIFKAADVALYNAKSNGRNRVEFAAILTRGNDKRASGQ